MIRHDAKVMSVTPDYARKVMDNESFPDQRKKSKDHIAFLREVMMRGEFDGGESIRFAEYAGHRYLINGQHRMEAIASGGGTQHVVVVTSHCDTAHEAALLYSRIDRGRGRNVADALYAIGATDEGMTHRQVMAMMACAPMFSVDLRHATISGNNYSSKSAEGRSATMDQWKKAAKRYFQVISQAQFGNDRELMHREVVAVGIATFQDMPAAERAAEFWGGVAADDGLAATDPRKQCLEFLKKGRGRVHRVPSGWVSHGVTACWNAWMRGAPLKLVKIIDHRAPLRIAGTRFSKRLEDGSLDVGKVTTLPRPVLFDRLDAKVSHN